MSRSTVTTSAVERENESIIHAGRMTTHIGFALMLSWHYLILFSPAFGDVSKTSGFEYLFLRQLTLYVAIGAAFYAVWAHGKWQMSHGGRKTAFFSAPVVIVGAMATIISFIYVSNSFLDLPVPVRLALIGALGIMQAYLMVLWTRCLMNKGSGHILPSFGIYMISGGVIALLICFFQWPMQQVITSVLPCATALLLTYEKRLDQAAFSKAKAPGKTDEADGQADEADSEAAPIPAHVVTPAKAEGTKAKARMSLRNKRMILFSALFAFAFGLLQGAFIMVQVPVLIVGDPFVLVGIIVAGLLLHSIPKTLGVTLSVDMMHRFSLILFVVGSIVISWHDLGAVPLFIAQIALLAGFNLFDFGVFAYGIEGHWHKDLAPNGADFARPVVYLCMTLGLLLGKASITLTPFSSTPTILSVICGTAVILIVVTTLMPLSRLKPVEDGEPADEKAPAGAPAAEKQPVMVSLSSFPSETLDARLRPAGSERHESPWRSACKEIAKWYQLSPRETEIFMLVAKGRNADYIQQSLTISTHTAKTHIANIYHKLDVHSMQELLDLVEKYRDEGKAKSGS